MHDRIASQLGDPARQLPGVTEFVFRLFRKVLGQFLAGKTFRYLCGDPV